MIEWLKEGKFNNWSVQHFELTEDDVRLENLRMTFSGIGYRRVDAGKYTRLVRGRTVVMSDTPAEVSYDLFSFKRQLKYANKSLPVHINGFGLGICVGMALDHGFTVEVVEICEDVLNLVASQYLERYGDEKLLVIQANALEWKPDTYPRYSMVWHDIWDTICQDNWDEYKTLHRRYGRKTDWQDSWARDLLKREMRQDRNRYW